MFEEVVIVRGGGDIASGTIQKLYRSGFKVLVLEVEKPTSIRRKVCFSEAIYDGEIVIEGVKCISVKNLDEIKEAWKQNIIPIIIDPKGEYINSLKPDIVVDAILAKENLGTDIDMAEITIALGPGFEAGRDVDIVIETMRGHDLARLIFKGRAMKDTGMPGAIEGFSKERVIYSPCDGIIKNTREIGSIVKAGEIIAFVDDMEVKATIAGILRGLIREESKVFRGLKIADIDPRFRQQKNCDTISDKARNIAGAVLEGILLLINNNSKYKK